MPNIKDLQTLKINYLTQDKYNELLAQGQIDEDQLYFTPHESIANIVQMNELAETDSNTYPLMFADSTVANTGDMSEGFYYPNLVFTPQLTELAIPARNTSYGTLSLYTINNGAKGSIIANGLSADRLVSLPDKNGTIALTSDIPTVPTLADMGGFNDLDVGGTTAPLWLDWERNDTVLTITGGVNSASTSAKGVVQLSTSVSSTSTTLAATSSAVKAAYDKAAAAMPQSGGTFTGNVIGVDNTSYTTATLKNIVLSTSAASNPTNYPKGTIWIQYVN